MIGYVVGMVLGAPIALVIFVVSLVRKARAVHAEGLVCRGALTSSVPELNGPALVRLSGAFTGLRDTAPDVLGVMLRLQATAVDDAAIGDQDLPLASFESFATARRDRAATIATSFVANHYASVTPWTVRGRAAIIRLIPTTTETAADRPASLEADLAADRAVWQLALGDRARPEVIGSLRLSARLTIDDRPLRASLRRHARGIRPCGIRNGIRAVVYPMSQAARRLRGG